MVFVMSEKNARPLKKDVDLSRGRAGGGRFSSKCLRGGSRRRDGRELLADAPQRPLRQKTDFLCLEPFRCIGIEESGKQALVECQLLGPCWNYGANIIPLPAKRNLVQITSVVCRVVFWSYHKIVLSQSLPMIHISLKRAMSPRLVIDSKVY